jgi:hypothetical protein
MNLLEKIRQRNDHEKSVIAFATAIVVTFMIFLFWVYNVGDSWSGAKKDTQLSDISPVSFFEDNLSKTVDSMKGFPLTLDEMNSAATSSSATTTATNGGILTTESGQKQ